jgi:hypothetical protein
LHSRLAGKDIGSLSHQPRSVDFRPSSNDFTLSESLLLGSRRERGSDLWGEDDVLDENRLDEDTPFLGNLAYNF